MKKLFLLALGLFISVPAFAISELVQVVGFSWDGEALQFETLGSGTAVESDVILTNRHVVVNDGEQVDFVLLCPAKAKTTQAVQCNIPAAVMALHPTLDAALIRPLDPEVTFRPVRRITHDPVIGTSIRIEGFPIQTEDFGKFGSQKTISMINNWLKNGGVLEAKGDNLTISRGRIERIGRLKTETENFGRFFWTNVKANFGNSGGAAFDGLRRFIGMPTLRDQEYNAFVLAISQLEPWIETSDRTIPQLPPAIQKYYEAQLAKKTLAQSLKAQSVDYTQKSFSKRWKRKTAPKKRYEKPQTEEQPVETATDSTPVVENQTTIFQRNSKRVLSPSLLHQMYFQ